MTEELLSKIKENANTEIANLDEYNTYAKLRNKLAEQEELKRRLGLLYTSGLELPEENEDDIIMLAYEKYLGDIASEKDTNGIYFYIGSYRYLNPSMDEIEEGHPLEEEVARDDPSADFRRYANLEGHWSWSFGIEESKEFERTHTVLCTDNIYEAEKLFITTAVKENQEKAVSLILKKYKKIK